MVVMIYSMYFRPSRHLGDQTLSKLFRSSIFGAKFCPGRAGRDISVKFLSPISFPDSFTRKMMERSRREVNHGERSWSMIDHSGPVEPTAFQICDPKTNTRPRIIKPSRASTVYGSSDSWVQLDSIVIFIDDGQPSFLSFFKRGRNVSRREWSNSQRSSVNVNKGWRCVS